MVWVYKTTNPPYLTTGKLWKQQNVETCLQVSPLAITGYLLLLFGLGKLNPALLHFLGDIHVNVKKKLSDSDSHWESLKYRMCSLVDLRYSEPQALFNCTLFVVIMKQSTLILFRVRLKTRIKSEKGLMLESSAFETL